MTKFVKFSTGTKSFLKGMSRAFDLFGKLDRTKQMSDSDALKKDWEMVGADIQYAISSYERKRK